MARSSALQQLTDRLDRIEEEIRAARWHLEELRREPHTGAAVAHTRAPRLPRVEKAVLRNWAADLFRDLSIEEETIGALEVQERSQSSGLEPNELSRSLIQARDE